MRTLTLVVLLVVASSAAFISAPAKAEEESLHNVASALQDLYNLLKRSYEIGSDELRKALADPRVEALIAKFTGLAKETALRMIRYFKSLLEESSFLNEEALIEAQSESFTEEDQSYIQLTIDLPYLTKVFKFLAEAKKRGLTALRDALNSAELAEFIESIQSPELSEKVKQYVARLKKMVEDRLEADEGYNSEALGLFGDNDLDILKDMWYALTVAAKAGKATLLRVIDDSLIRQSIMNLTAFAKKVALNMLRYFESKLESKTESYSPGSEEPTAKQILADILRLLHNAKEKGILALKKLLESEELKQRLQKLPENLLQWAKSYIALFKSYLQKMLEEKDIQAMIAVVETVEDGSDADNQNPGDLLDEKDASEDEDEERVSAAQIVRLIRRYIQQAAKDGREKLNEALDSEKLKSLLAKLPTFLQKPINVWLEGMRKLANLEAKDFENWLNKLRN